MFRWIAYVSRLCTFYDPFEMRGKAPRTDEHAHTYMYKNMAWVRVWVCTWLWIWVWALCTCVSGGDSLLMILPKKIRRNTFCLPSLPCHSLHSGIFDPTNPYSLPHPSSHTRVSCPHHLFSPSPLTIHKYSDVCATQP